MAISSQNNLFVSSLKFIAKDIIGDILYFPIWWYSAGLKKLFMGLWNNLRSLASGLSLPILFRHLLKPMYGDYTKSGRAISLIMRLIQFAFLSVGVFIWAILLLTLALAWIILPIIIIYNVIFQIFGPF
ncbi:MAG: hypothetical protein ABIB97_05295 [Patescibacteria group bacterium]